MDALVVRFAGPCAGIRLSFRVSFAAGIRQTVSGKGRKLEDAGFHQAESDCTDRTIPGSPPWLGFNGLVAFVLVM